jgi:hypothetical protein
MFGRRKLAKELQRQLDERENDAIVAAHDAVGHVVAAFMTHPDVYAPKACIAARNPRPDSRPYLMFKLDWDDAILGEYRLDGDASLIVRDVVEMGGDQSPADIVVPWLEPHEAGQVEFRALPGIFQEAFARYWTGREIPFSETFLLWAHSYGAPADGDQPFWTVRRFPAGATDGGPALGQLGYEVVPRELITAWFEQRGW